MPDARAAVAALALAVPAALAAAPPTGAGLPAAPACLPDGSGYLRARLRGDLEERLDWHGPALECAGMSRPDARGLRLRFAGPLADGRRLALVIAAPQLAEGAGGAAVPVNVTLMVEGTAEFFGTRGTDRCQLDQVSQAALADPALPPRSFRIEGRGYCTAPAPALKGSGAVLVTRFDFAGRVTFAEDDGAAAGPAAEANR